MHKFIFPIFAIFLVMGIAAILLWLVITSQPQDSLQQPPAETYPFVPPNAPKEVHKEGSETVLRDITGGTTTGTATREWADTSMNIKVEAILPDPGSNHRYVTLVANDTSGDVRFLEQLERVSNDSWLLLYSTQEDLSGYDTIIIARDTTDILSLPEYILRGEF